MRQISQKVKDNPLPNSQILSVFLTFPSNWWRTASWNVQKVAACCKESSFENGKNMRLNANYKLKFQCSKSDEKFLVFMHHTVEIAHLFDSKQKLKYNALVFFSILSSHFFWDILVCFQKKKTFFFRHFLERHLVNLTKKINFWKMKKILSKIFKKAVFLLIWGRKGFSVNPPILEDPILNTFIR